MGRKIKFSQLAFVAEPFSASSRKIHLSTRMNKSFSPNLALTNDIIYPTGFESSPNLILAQEVGKTFEPVAPDSSTLIGFGVVVLLSIIASVVWANEVVPVSRTKLALSKRDGEVKKYLDELKEGVNGTNDIDADVSSETEGEDNEATVREKKSDGRDFERWLFTDWLENNKSAGKPGRKKEPALPILKSAKWNSGDNPVLVTFAMMMVGVLIAAISERGSFT